MQSELTFDESTVFLRFREVFWGFSFVFRRGGRQAGAADARAGAGAGGGGVQCLSIAPPHTGSAYR